jgi:hypothetical protein
VIRRPADDACCNASAPVKRENCLDRAGRLDQYRQQRPSAKYHPAGQAE